MTSKSQQSKIRNFRIFRLRGQLNLFRTQIPDDVIRQMDNHDYVNLMNGLNELEIALNKVKKKKK